MRETVRAVWLCISGVNALMAAEGVAAGNRAAARAWLLHVALSIGQPQIASALGLTKQNFSKLVKTCERRMDEDRLLLAQMERIRAKILEVGHDEQL